MGRVMDLDVVFIGTAGSVPTPRRGLPATLLRRGGDRVLVDCGEGTQRQLIRSVGLVEIDALLITHFHADHVLGLPGLLKTYALGARERPLALHGPRGLERLLGVLAPVIGRLPFELHVSELDAGEQVERDGYRLAAFEVEHRTRALGYALIENERPGRFDERLARELGVTPGPEFGRLQRGETVAGVRPEQVIGAPRPGRTVVLTGDTSPCAMTSAVAHRADLLVHEATFADDAANRARETGHSTALAAGELAAAAEVKLLALTHVSSRYAGGELRDEARGAFAASIVPHDFDRVEIPLPERGEPEHVRARDGRPSPTAEPSPASPG